MKDKAYIYLPDGKCFKLENKAPNGVFTDEGMSEIRRMFASADSVYLNIIVDGRADCLILWGEVLKNSYIKIERGVEKE